MEIHAATERETKAAAQAFAAKLRQGDIVFLKGDLGAGKTAFARAVIHTLTGNPEETVPSPTYTLVQVYEANIAPVWHFDLYRLSGPDEVFELGWEEALAGGIVLVEWPERLGDLAPEEHIAVTLIPEDGGRRIRIRSLEDIAGRAIKNP